ncbi:HAD-IA family hydrolase [Candidatus Micrarchaeota archaeon]|nr:HAD-IA family hydrolase [Candidatus Micrarchaeota archaeon]
MKMNSCFLFDFDGVIVDSTEFIHQSFLHTFSMKNSNLPENFMQLITGKPVQECFTMFGVREADLPSFLELYRSFQKENMTRLVNVFPEVIDTLSFLKEKGFKTGIVTGRGKTSTNEILNYYNLTNYFDCIITPEDTLNYKPHPEPVLKALELLGGEATSSFFVGDSETDIQAGKAAGVKTIAAAYTAGTSLNALGPDYIIDSLKELKILAEK